MAINKRYYWLKLPEDFFQSETIRWLEEQPNGIYYSNFYLKLCLMSINDNGMLIRRVGEMYIPYDIKRLSELTNINSDTIMIAINLLKKLGLLEVLDNGAFYLNQVKNMVGSESESAKRVRKHRNKTKALQCNETETQKKQLCNKSVTQNETTDIRDKIIDIRDKRIDIRVIDKENATTTDLQKKEVIDIYMNNINYSINSIEYERLIDDIDEYGVEWVKEAITRAVMQGKRKLGYIEAILNNWKVNGYDEYKTKNKVNTANSSKLSDAEQLALNRAPKSLLDEFLEQEGIKKNG
uniref:phage replisome organizer N-terminal domain-containing protein n=3 Tax=Megamonas TaxID=158846 RepID=UPI0026769B08|nr:phage replisome organizer N-terminal domain-containing protein [Megamonas funiformis]